MVMPSCAPESMKEVRLVMSSARWADLSPSAAMDRNWVRSTDMNENSCATK